MTQRNSPERAQMLDYRAERQRNRRTGYYTPDGVWRGEHESKFPAAIWPARLNRRTGKPHQHDRARARRLRKLGIGA